MARDELSKLMTPLMEQYLMHVVAVKLKVFAVDVVSRETWQHVEGEDTTPIDEFSSLSELVQSLFALVDSLSEMRYVDSAVVSAATKVYLRFRDCLDRVFFARRLWLPSFFLGLCAFLGKS